jgi:hypothetical protein
VKRVFEYCEISGDKFGNAMAMTKIERKAAKLTQKGGKP